MKLLVALVVVAYVVNGALANCLAIDEEDVKKIIAIKKECMESTGIDKEVVEKIKHGGINDDKLTKEFIFCFLKKGGLIDDNNKVNTDLIKTVLFKKHGEAAADSMMKTCGDKTGPTALETAYLMMKCYKHNAPHKEYFL